MSIYPASKNRSLIYQLATTPEDVMGFYKKNSDFPGYREVKENVEQISYRSDSGIRIWYNNLPITFDFHRHNALEIIVPVEIDGKEVARATAPFTEEALNRRQTRANRKVGRL